MFIPFVIRFSKAIASWVVPITLGHPAIGTHASTNNTATQRPTEGTVLYVWTGHFGNIEKPLGNCLNLPSSVLQRPRFEINCCVLWLCRWDVREPSDPCDPAWHWPSGSGAAGPVRLHCRNCSRRGKCAGMSPLVSFEVHSIYHTHNYSVSGYGVCFVRY